MSVKKSLIFGVIAMAISTIVSALPSGVAGYGVYIKNSEKYLPVTAYDANVVKIKTINNILNVDNKGASIELLIYQKDFDQSAVTFKKSDFANFVTKNNLSANIESVKNEKDLYRVTFKDSFKNAAIIYINSHQLFGWNQGAIVIGNIEKGLEITFSDKNRTPADILPDLKNAIEVFPNNKEFKALLPKIQKAKTDVEAERYYGYADEEWEKYKNAKSLKAKISFLKRCKAYLNGYLEKYPNEKRADEAKKRIETINSKLEI